ncbi:MAG: phosphotransferase [Actinomycetota bacterium]
MHSTTIPTIDDLSPTWFETLLREQGDLDDQTNVLTATLTPFGNAQSMMSALYRATLTYDRLTAAPTTLIVKLASASDRQRFIAGMFKFYEREIRFYDEIQSEVPVRTPRCWLAAIHPDEPMFVLVLEEISGCRQVDQIDGMGLDDALTCVATLADLHAPFWGKDLSVLAETFMPMNSEGMQMLLPANFANDWAGARDKVIDVLSPEVFALCDRFGDIATRLLDDMQGPDTLAHSDFRSDNVLFDTDGSVIALDFQLTAVCNGFTDVAYFISQSVRDDVASAHADTLIDAYIARLGEHGIVCDRDDALRHYRAGLVFFLSIPVSLFAADSTDVHARGIALAEAMLRRAAAEIIRTGAHLQYA